MKRTNPIRLTDDQRQKAAANTGLIWHFSKRRYEQNFIAQFGMDEYLSVAHETLCRTAQRHDPARGAFGTLFGRILWQDLGKERKKRPNDLLNDLNVGLGTPNLKDHGYKDVDDADLARACLRRLTPAERRIVHLRADGLTYARLGDLVGLTGERIRQLLQAIRQKCMKVAIGATLAMIVSLAGCQGPSLAVYDPNEGCPLPTTQPYQGRFSGNLLGLLDEEEYQ